MKENKNEKTSMRALADFMIQYDLLKTSSGLTQKDVATLVGTTQSSISRFECGEQNPTYKFLEALSNAVGGSLVISPMSDMTFTVPFGMQSKMREIAEQNNTTVKKILLDYTRYLFEYNGLSIGQCVSVKSKNKKKAKKYEDDLELAA